MSALRGLGVGFLALTLLEAAVTSQKAASNASGLVKAVTGAINRVVDPTVPLIPDRTATLQAQHPGDTILASGS